MSRPVPRRATGRRRAASPRRPRRLPLLPALVVLLAVALVAAVVGGAVAVLGGGTPEAGSGGAGPSSGPATDAAGSTSTAEAGAAPPEAAVPAPPPRPRVGACYDLTHAQAVAATTRVAAGSCKTPHTARTFAVGVLPTLADGHLLAVDSARAQGAPARSCPARLRDHLGGDRDARRLTMLRAVWFTPTLAEADRGAAWYRCDVVALAGDERLAPLGARLRGVLDRPAAAAAYAVCGTAEPGTAGFERVACSRPHRWRAVEVVDLAGRRYPGAAAVRAAGQAPCEEVGRDRATDPLSFQWGYEWPTRDQWADGITWGLCWVPDGR